MNLKIIMLIETPDTKGHILHDSIYMKHPEEVNPLRQKTNLWLPGAGEGQ